MSNPFVDLAELLSDLLSFRDSERCYDSEPSDESRDLARRVQDAGGRVDLEDGTYATTEDDNILYTSDD